MSHPAFSSYDFRLEKRLPKNITKVLDGFIENIFIKIDQKGLSRKNREAMYLEVLSSLEILLKTSTDAKEQKIL